MAHQRLGLDGIEMNLASLHQAVAAPVSAEQVAQRIL